MSDGKLIWADSLATLAPRTPLEELGDILANPVHDGDAVYVVSQSGILGAFDSLTGIQLWEQPISSVQMPWVAGESLFVLTTSSIWSRCVSRMVPYVGIQIYREVQSWRYFGNRCNSLFWPNCSCWTGSCSLILWADIQPECGYRCSG